MARVLPGVVAGHRSWYHPLCCPRAVPAVSGRFGVVTPSGVTCVGRDPFPPLSTYITTRFTPPMPPPKGKRASAKKDRRPKRKVCTFCAERLHDLDYKDTTRLRKYISERGKILPRRISGNCASHQRALTTAVKRARVIALLPFVVQ